MLFINSQLPWKEGLVYSVLVRRFNIDKWTSRRKLKVVTGMDFNTVKTTVDKLMSLGLVVENRGRNSLFPKKPEGDVAALFLWRTAQIDKWWKRFTFFHFELKVSPRLSQLRNIVYWKLRDLERQGHTWQTQKGLAKLLRFSRTMIAETLKKLVELKLLEITRLRRGFGIKTLLPKDAEFWKQKKKAPKEQQTEDLPAWIAPEPDPAPVKPADEWAKHRAENDYPEGCVMDDLMVRWRKAGVSFRDCCWLSALTFDKEGLFINYAFCPITRLTEEAQIEHSSNVKNGKVKGDSTKFGTLLVHKVRALVQRMRGQPA